MAMNRAQIDAVDDRPIELFDVPEWGGSVNLRPISATDRAVIERMSFEFQDGKAREDLRTILCAMTLVDNVGKRLYNDSEIHILGQRSAAALDRVFTRAQKLSGIGSAEIDGLAKNSDAAPSGGSTSS